LHAPNASNVTPPADHTVPSARHNSNTTSLCKLKLYVKPLHITCYICPPLSTHDRQLTSNCYKFHFTLNFWTILT